MATDVACQSCHPLFAAVLSKCVQIKLHCAQDACMVAGGATECQLDSLMKAVMLKHSTAGNENNQVLTPIK